MIVETIEREDLRNYLPTMRGRGWDDGYDWMAKTEESTAWRAVSGWGLDGWDLGDWPYVIVLVARQYVSDDLTVYGVATHVEGDIDVRAYASYEDQRAALDEIAAFYWRHGHGGPKDFPPVGPAREEHCGPFSMFRLDEVGK